MSAADLDALRYDPDYVLTTVPEATRRFEQIQLRLDTRYRTWLAGASATVSSLTGNFNVVTGPDDYSTSSAGPWVLLNEQFNFLGDLNNQSLLEGKLYLGGLLPAGFRGGAFFSYATGDRVTPTLTISSLLTNYAVVVPRTSDPTLSDTLTFHSLLFSSTSGQRIFLQPRGSYRYQSRASLDLHLERSFPRGRTEVVLVLDGFNVLGDRSVTEVQTVVNAAAGRGHRTAAGAARRRRSGCPAVPRVERGDPGRRRGSGTAGSRRRSGSRQGRAVHHRRSPRTPPPAARRRRSDRSAAPARPRVLPLHHRATADSGPHRSAAWRRPWRRSSGSGTLLPSRRRRNRQCRRRRPAPAEPPGAVAGPRTAP